MVVVIALGRDAHAGVFVTVHNGGTSTLKNVTLSAGDFGCELGSIRPGESRGIRVTVGGDANLIVIVERADGRPEHHDANVYFEPGTLGWISVRLADGVDDSVRDWTF